MPTALELRDVDFVRRFRRDKDARVMTIFSNLNLTVDLHDRVALIGANGVGKSTLLRIMAGVLPPDKGRVERKSPTKVILDPAVGLEPALSGRDNAQTLLRLQGTSHDVAKLKLAEITEFSELGAFIDEPVKTYSAGMVSRLVVSTQLLNIGNSGLLLDEGIGAADSRFQSKVLNEIEKRFETLSFLVLASHDVVSLTRYCDRGIVLQPGKIAFDGHITDALDFYRAST